MCCVTEKSTTNQIWFYASSAKDSISYLPTQEFSKYDRQQLIYTYIYSRIFLFGVGISASCTQYKRSIVCELAFVYTYNNTLNMFAHG